METPTLGKREHALQKIILRLKLQLWASKSRQERDKLADEIMQLFSSTMTNNNNNSNNGSLTTITTITTAAAVPRPITRRPGVEEIKNCLLTSVYPCIPPQSSSLRGEIWQVLLNVYKRNQHGSAAQEFDRMITRLSKLPRDPLLVEECAVVSGMLVETDQNGGSVGQDRARLQNELEILLMWFLTTKSVPYTTGMARVVAPFFLLQLPLPTIYDCFYQFCANFLPHFVNSEELHGKKDEDTNGGGEEDGVTTTTTTEISEAETSGQTNEAEAKEEQSETQQQRQQLAEQLLSYHAPQLVHVLTQWCANDWSKPGLLIPSNFFLGDLYQVIPPKLFVYVMDQYLLTGDNMFGFFLLNAVLMQREDEITACTSRSEIKEKIQTIFEMAFRHEDNVQFLCLLAARLRMKTPRSYKCSQPEASPDARCSSRLATEIAFGTAKDTKKQNEPVDMSQWVKKESRSIAGKIFWYNKGTGKTQWEHPIAKFEGTPASFALPVSVDEVGSQVMGERSNNDGLHFFVVDCRGLRSSNDMKSGRIPAAYTLDPSVFDSPEVLEKSMEAFNPMKSRVHVVLVGHGVGIPPKLVTTEEIKTSIRDAVRHDADCINRAALFFQKRGFRFVSCLDGGYSSWHAFMRDNAGSSPQELLNHVEDECHYCRYDTILRTGEDPFKKKAQETRSRRKKSAMPTTTTMLVNGGEGDSSIISSNSGNGPPSSGSRRSLVLSRTSIASMRTKFSEVKMPKLQWGRRSSSTVSSNQNDSGSSSETLEEGGSDRPSSASTNDDMDDKSADDSEIQEILRSALQEGASPKDPNKEFVGLFTIDYSDDEEEEGTKDEEQKKPTTQTSVAANAAPVVVPTLSA